MRCVGLTPQVRGIARFDDSGKIREYSSVNEGALDVSALAVAQGLGIVELSGPSRGDVRL
jgi:hypothetical protein